jgi:hypothetical protein
VTGGTGGLDRKGGSRQAGETGGGEKKELSGNRQPGRSGLGGLVVENIEGERFGVSARHVFVSAQEAARSRNAATVGTEHLLLGIFVDRDGLGAGILRSHGVSIETVSDVLRRYLDPRRPVPAGPPQLAESATRAIGLAAEAADRMGSREIAAEHLLLGMIAHGEGMAVRILVDLGVHLGELRAEVTRQLRADVQRGEANRSSATVGPPVLASQDLDGSFPFLATGSVAAADDPVMDPPLPFSRLAIAGLILSLFAALIFTPVGCIGMSMSSIAFGRIRQGKARGRWIAIAGFCIGAGAFAYFLIRSALR